MVIAEGVVVELVVVLVVSMPITASSLVLCRFQIYAAYGINKNGNKFIFAITAGMVTNKAVTPNTRSLNNPREPLEPLELLVKRRSCRLLVTLLNWQLLV